MRFALSPWPALAAFALVAGGFAGGCTSFLGIDGTYVAQGSNGTGGTSAGGTGGASTGGTGDAGSGGTAGACTDISQCGAGTKCCDGACVTPSPDVGCSLNDCSPCPQAIANTEPLCDGSQCSARCASGYVPYGGACVLASSIDGSAGGTGGNGGTTGTGGGSSGGTAGTGGTSAQCTPSTCPDCSFNPKGPVRCCMQDGSCSCSWFNVGTVGYCM